LLSVVTFFQGPTILTQEKTLMFAQGFEGTINVVTYMPGSATDKTAVDQLKPFRQLNQTLKTIGHINFFVVEDEEIARAFGLDTSSQGDWYLVRQSDNAYRSRTAPSRQKQFSIFGFPFTSEMLLPAENTRDFRTVERAVYNLILAQPLYFQDILARN